MLGYQRIQVSHYVLLQLKLLPLQEQLEMFPVLRHQWSEDYYCLKLSYDSMEPTLKPGDIVLTSPGAASEEHTLTSRIGNFIFGKMSPYWQGTYTHFDGSVYTGDFENGKYHGRGTYEYVTGETYTGDFREGRINGKGKFVYADGSRYVGEFSNGKRNGMGTYILADGTELNGEFKNGHYVLPDNGNGDDEFREQSMKKY